MSEILHKLRESPEREVFATGEGWYSAGDLLARIESLIALMSSRGIRRAALFADNGLKWLVTDLACQAAGVALLPLPLFFSASQIRHCLALAGPEIILTDNSPSFDGRLGLERETWRRDNGSGVVWTCPARIPEALLPEGTAKITFTSGSTGSPKGVCLGEAQLGAVARSLLQATGLSAPRHLCLMPLSTLLENLAGVHAPLLAEGQVIAPALSEVGLRGSSELDVGQLLNALDRYQPNTVILIPQLLTVLATACEMGWRPPQSLRFMAVGGAPVSPALLTRARAYGLPVYEGYGLSECASVVALNRPKRDKPGSVGTVLDHLQVRVEHGEILVSGNTFLGYAGDPESWNRDFVSTGDLGYFDSDGFLHVDGRRKNVMISSFGRNFSPEWIEAELIAGPLLAQCVVFGDSRPACSALLYPRDPATTNGAIQKWLDRVNETLPDYARIHHWLRLPEPLSKARGTLTENQRLKRDAIYDLYSAEIENLYSLNETAS